VKALLRIAVVWNIPVAWNRAAFAYFNLGRAEDPSFTIKVFTVTAAWPGALPLRF
jgi:multidrug efflux pump subunit AcrB